MSRKTVTRRSLLAGSALLALAAPFPSTGHAQDEPFPLVVDLAWLARRADQPGLRIFDVSPLHVWDNGHLDSAQHAWWRDTVDPNYPVFGAVLTQGDDQSHRQQVLDSLGLSVGDDVVVYDDADGFRAARLVWFLRFLGFEQAALLNANRADWSAAAFPVPASGSDDAPVEVDPQAGYYLVTSQLLDRIGSPILQLLDIRTDRERADDVGGTVPTGQIPGSVRFPWDDLLDDAGHLRPPADILELAQVAGLQPDKPTVLYGTFGVDAALPWLALADAGFDDLQTYDRGWAEWSIGAGLPREPLA